ncbi:magnesium protoporphyrin IX methyltransferase [Novosphingobium cyanobacteriorum]|uniref:Magnesium protoporphyrin IX methyltransferase n=1 Tax=Novosphingobium cyanobacteriorum TaxID=3024215 RepID=A0ABT6CKI8_9SPHN|nr:magnesium protoporphyrin IX methyltransferase [Novosphingobium cyanobacteriorum]MDF8334439.1 magnesium protoporphyrin IX methyltransferase [Novosphingobium cyanobacteriorum]
MATQAPSPYDLQRERLAQYFDGTARKAWIDLTSNAKVSGIRATVRAGRDAMRAQLLGWLPEDLRRCDVLDAGCGTGSLSVEAACRGAMVTAIDVAGGLVDIAQQRAPSFLGHGRIDWHVGDMLAPPGGTFDHVVAMDSLIHYDLDHMVWALETLTQRCTGSLVFTFAPHTRLLGAMHAVGKAFPRSNRSPAIVPIAENALRERLARLSGWRVSRSGRISSGFYISHGMELVRR